MLLKAKNNRTNFTTIETHKKNLGQQKIYFQNKKWRKKQKIKSIIKVQNIICIKKWKFINSKKKAETNKKYCKICKSHFETKKTKIKTISFSLPKRQVICKTINKI